MPNKTTSYYTENAEAFYQSTVSVNAGELYQRFLPLIPAGGRILDAGCGSGRDAKAFKDLGFDVVAFDACEPLAKMASELLAGPVLTSTFLDFHNDELFDGIWACASLLHVAGAELPQTMQHLATLLKPSGVFYCSFKQGDGEEFRNGRQFTYMTEAQMRKLAGQASLAIHELWMTEDLRPDRPAEFWVNAVLVKAH